MPIKVSFVSANSKHKICFSMDIFNQKLNAVNKKVLINRRLLICKLSTDEPDENKKSSNLILFMYGKMNLPVFSNMS